MSYKTIITGAVTGNITRPNLPVTPEQIAAPYLEGERPQASIARIHTGDLQTSQPGMEITEYSEVIERIKEAISRLITNLSTDSGGLFIPHDGGPRFVRPVTLHAAPLQTVEPDAELKPELRTINLNTIQPGNSIVINAPRNVRIMAQAIRAAGVLPELEVFDSGDVPPKQP